jgi:hypothetical protein
MSLFRFKLQYSTLKGPFLDLINNFETRIGNFENPK